MKRPFRIRKGLTHTLLAAALICAVSWLSLACSGQVKKQAAESGKEKTAQVSDRGGQEGAEGRGYQAGGGALVLL